MAPERMGCFVEKPPVHFLHLTALRLRELTEPRIQQGHGQPAHFTASRGKHLPQVSG